MRAATSKHDPAEKFKIADFYSAAEIQGWLGVGNAGGIRVALDNNRRVQRVVLLTATPNARIAKENPYHDRVEADVLVYTAAGLQGDQSLGGVNKRLLLQPEEGFPIYGFRLTQNRRKTGVRRWEFLGLLQFLRHYPDAQIDSSGARRRIWVFELRVCPTPPVVHVEGDRLAMQAALASQVAPEITDRVVIQPELPSNEGSARAEAEIVERVRSQLLGLSPVEFEHIVKRALTETGFNRVEVTKYSSDGGIDVDAYAGNSFWPLAGLHLQVQAKRWLHTVGRREVAELRGSLSPYARGAVVTTSHFSRAALTEASAEGKNPVVLVDGYSFAFTVKHLGIL